MEEEHSADKMEWNRSMKTISEDQWGLLERLADEQTSNMPIDAVYQMVKKFHFFQLLSFLLNEPETFKTIAEKSGGLTVDNYEEAEYPMHPYTMHLINCMTDLWCRSHTEEGGDVYMNTLAKTRDEYNLEMGEETIEPPFNADFFKGLK